MQKIRELAGFCSHGLFSNPTQHNFRIDTNINTDGGTYINGNINTGGGKFIGRDDNSRSGMDGNEAAKLFAMLFAKIDAHPKLDKDEKADLKAEIDELRKELTQKSQPDETFLMRRLRNIGRMAPDILDVTLATIASPSIGFGVIAEKLANKIRSRG